MLGNDVIDLGDPETRARHARFDARVFTPAERAALAGAADAERLRWRLWAAKEAAFKCAAKLAPGTRFVPRCFAVELEGERRASVRCGELSLRVVWLDEGELVHAIATDGADPERDVLRGTARVAEVEDPESASRTGHALLTELAAARLGCHARELAIARNGRAPRLLRLGLPLGFDCSLAHHGRFAAAAVERSPVRGSA
jgi:hypothetical protein